MGKKSKLPKISDQEVEELTNAVQYAYGNNEADDFLDCAFAHARKLQKRRGAQGEQPTVPERGPKPGHQVVPENSNDTDYE